MSVAPSQIQQDRFTISVPGGSPTDPDSTPTCTLILDGTADAAVVTVTSVTGTGRFRYSVVIPSDAAGKTASIQVEAEISSEPYEAHIRLGVVRSVVTASSLGLGAGRVNHVSPVSEAGDELRVRRGDAYTANSKLLAWTEPEGANWPTPTADPVMTIRSQADDSVVLSVTGSWSTNGDGLLHFEVSLSSEETALLNTDHRSERFDVEYPFADGYWTVAEGWVVCFPDQTRH